ncbi:MAG: hypothetical protein QM499_09835 [Flavobacteriaceae bacterium]
MNIISPAKTYLFSAFFLIFLSTTLFSQVGINTTTPAEGAMLDISSTNKGLLLPRIIIDDLSTIDPITGDGTESLLVYNISEITPKGFYYWDSSKWAVIGGNDWSLLGNAGTNPATNFIGTTDNVDLVLKTNDSEQMRILNGGQVIINDTTPFVGDRFTVTGSNNESVINAFATGTNGVGIYAESIDFDAIVGDGSRFGVVGIGTYGIYGVGSSRGVYGSANSATGFGMIANNDNSTGVGILASGANAPLNYLNSSGGTFNGVTAIAGFSTNSSGTGISGIGNGGTTSRTLTNGSGVAGNGDTGVYGFSILSTGTGMIAVGNNSTTITTHPSGSGIAASGTNIGVFGYAGNGDTSNSNRGNAGGEFVLDADNDPTTNTNNDGTRARAILAGFNSVTPNGSLSNEESYFGGYFSGGSESSGTPSYAYVGMRYQTNNDGTSGATDFKIIGTGSNSTMVNDSNGNKRILFSPEAPEILFQDFGVGQLVNGQIRINIDPLLKEALFVDNEHPLKVYVTLEGECNGIYVTNKSADGFNVIELQGGNSNASFSWQIVANRADTKDRNGNIVSKHVGVRLPIGPEPLTTNMKKQEVSSETTKLIKDSNRIERDINIKKNRNTSNIISQAKK